MSHENVIDCMRRAIIIHIYLYIHDALLSQKFVDVSRDEPNRHLKAQGKQRGVMKSLSHVIHQNVWLFTTIYTWSII